MKIAKDIYFYRGDDVDYNRVYHGMASSNVVVIKGAEPVIIDCGIFKGKIRKNLLKEFDADGIKVENIKHILFTHFHPDHIVGAKYFLKKQQVSLWMHSLTQRYLHDSRFQLASYTNLPYHVRKEIFPVPKIFLKMFSRFLGYHFDYFRATHLFDKKPLELKARKIEVLPSFGHCEGHAAFYLPQEKVMLSGDIFTIKNHFGTSINSPLSDFEHSLKDLDMLLQKEIRTLIPGHEDIITGEENIQNLLSSLKKEMTLFPEKILNVISSGPQGIFRIMEVIFPRTNAGLKINNSNIIYNVLLYLEKNSLVERIYHKNQLLWKKI